MNRAALERMMLAEAQTFLANPLLAMKDLVEWCNREIKPHVGETVFHLPKPGVWVAIRKTSDKRKVSK